jgi:urease accessory protein
MKSRFTPTLIAAATVLFAAQIAQAHPGHAGHGGLTGGFAHPFSGIDHILAMIAVGILATQIGGKALWMLPMTFVALMAGGGLLNLAGLPVPFVEQGIMASVLVFGLLIALSIRLPLVMPLVLVGIFAIFHGFAHVAEMHAGMSPAGYAIGFIAATTILHAIGITLDLAARRLASINFVRLAGAAIAACGLLLFLGLIHA